jgi:hypothetical protein
MSSTRQYGNGSLNVLDENTREEFKLEKSH